MEARTDPQRTAPAEGGRTPRLVADIGGTHARFAYCDAAGRLSEAVKIRVEDYPGPVEAVRDFLRGTKVSEAVLAVATPVSGDRIDFTNSPWGFSIREVRDTLGLSRLVVLNDFLAQALAVPALAAGEREEIRGGTPEPGQPIAVLGPGTGLGMASLVPDRSGWRGLASEGGHTTLAPLDDTDSAVIGRLRARFGHVSRERVISGPGLVNLAEALAELQGTSLGLGGPEEVTRRATEGDCPICKEALGRFAALLGASAGDLALTIAARGGVYIGGGLCKRLGPLFDKRAFSEAFLAKGRFHAYLDPVPVYLVTRKDPGLLGASLYKID